jgi:hypothetical protein
MNSTYPGGLVHADGDVDGDEPAALRDAVPAQPRHVRQLVHELLQRSRIQQATPPPPLSSHRPSATACSTNAATASTHAPRDRRSPIAATRSGRAEEEERARKIIGGVCCYCCHKWASDLRGLSPCSWSPFSYLR